MYLTQKELHFKHIRLQCDIAMGLFKLGLWTINPRHSQEGKRWKLYYVMGSI